MFYIPEADVSITFAKNQVEGSVEVDLRLFLQAVRDAGLLD